MIKSLRDEEIRTQRRLSRRRAMAVIGTGIAGGAWALAARSTPARAVDGDRRICGDVYDEDSGPAMVDSDLSPLRGDPGAGKPETAVGDPVDCSSAAMDPADRAVGERLAVDTYLRGAVPREK